MQLITLKQSQPGQKSYTFDRKMANDEADFTFPVLSSQATEEEKNLSLKEKLNLVDNEIRQLYEFCTKAGYTQPQIEQCAQPLLALQRREKNIQWLWRLLTFSFLVAFVAILFACDPTYRQICIYGKFVAMKVKCLFAILLILCFKRSPIVVIASLHYFRNIYFWSCFFSLFFLFTAISYFVK